MFKTEELSIRIATMKDARQLFDWKNEEAVRMNSIVSKDLIKWEDHLIWLRKTIKNPKRLLYLITDGVRNYGDIRFDRIGEYVEVSVRIEKDFRGRGIGTFIVRYACAKAQTWLKEKYFLAKIVAGNEPSLKVFTRNGFVVFDRIDGVDYLRRYL